jgi:hypothetical protein
LVVEAVVVAVLVAVEEVVDIPLVLLLLRYSNIL